MPWLYCGDAIQEGSVARLKRFESHRYVGTRDDMIVFDTDDDSQLATLIERVASEDLFGRNLLQTFAPDDLPEARNRGFRRRR